jgi:diguanylate cyclase (GGDEF)-like protein
LLQQLSNHLRDSVRDSDLVARLGGDEFVLVARDAEADAQLTANRLLAQWRDLRPDSTFSAGVAVHVRDDLPARTLELADKALYRAKERGRNQVRLDGEDPVDRFDKAAARD